MFQKCRRYHTTLFSLYQDKTKCIKRKEKDQLWELCVTSVLYCEVLHTMCLLHLLLMQWKPKIYTTEYYSVTIYITARDTTMLPKTSLSPTKNTTMKMKKNVLLLLYIPQSINQGHIPSITNSIPCTGIPSSLQLFKGSNATFQQPFVYSLLNESPVQTSRYNHESKTFTFILSTICYSPHSLLATVVCFLFSTVISLLSIFVVINKKSLRPKM